LIDPRKVVLLLLCVIAASAAASCAEHPNKLNLGRAVRDTLPLL
jgi:hypothetical protein